MSYDSGGCGSTVRDEQRVDALVEIGIDSPLKLDLVATIEQREGVPASSETLASLCGVSRRDAVPALEALAKAGLIQRRRFYNLTEYVSSQADEVRSLLGALVGAGPMEMRRLRCALLARAYHLVAPPLAIQR